MLFDGRILVASAFGAACLSTLLMYLGVYGSTITGLVGVRYSSSYPEIFMSLPTMITPVNLTLVAWFVLGALQAWFVYAQFFTPIEDEQLLSVRSVLGIELRWIVSMAYGAHAVWLPAACFGYWKVAFLIMTVYFVALIEYVLLVSMKKVWSIFQWVRLVMPLVALAVWIMHVWLIGLYQALSEAGVPGFEFREATPANGVPIIFAKFPGVVGTPAVGVFGVLLIAGVATVASVTEMEPAWGTVAAWGLFGIKLQMDGKGYFTDDFLDAKLGVVAGVASFVCVVAAIAGGVFAYLRFTSRPQLPDYTRPGCELPPVPTPYY